MDRMKHPINTAQKMKFSIQDFFSFLRIWSHLLKKSSFFVQCKFKFKVFFHISGFVLCNVLLNLSRICFCSSAIAVLLISLVHCAFLLKVECMIQVAFQFCYIRYMTERKNAERLQ